MSLLLALVADATPPEPEPTRRGSGSTRKRNRYEVDRFNDYEAQPIAIRNDDDECLVLMTMM
jgi:hypothetical protein